MSNLRVDTVNNQHQIITLMRSFLPCNKPITKMVISPDGSAIHIEYRQNAKETGFIAMQVGMKKNA